MGVVGFTINKMSVEKKGAQKGKMQIKNDISITDVQTEQISPTGVKQDILRFVFEFTSKYEPDYANIAINGELLYLADSKKIKELHDRWKKEKKMEETVMTAVLNSALTKCNVKAIILSNEMSLPPPIPMPKVEPKNN